ncbi:MAG: hypothetical protein ACK5OX_08500 [Desertimonas sp.]
MTAYPDTPRDHIATSYRALRLAIVVLVATLAISIVIERSRATCLEGSISAYYYTPAHSVLVGSLIALGVIMIALKGRDAIEDMLFNVAGVLAFVVGLVPTSRPTMLCTPTGDALDVPARAMVVNNIPALVIGAGLALGLAYLAALRQRKIDRLRLPRATATGLGVSLVLLAGGTAWYFAWNQQFARWAHGGAAAMMFVFIWLAVLVNVGWPAPLWRRVYRLLATPAPTALTAPTPRHRRAVRWYRAIAIAMPVGALVVKVLVDRRVEVFWIEVAEIVPFTVFWLVQTFEAWETGMTATAPAD